MAKETEQGQAAPAVVPGYGEADDEAASMNKAAHEEERHGRAGVAASSQSASDAPAEVVPDAAGPLGYGTTETNVKKRIAETASRKAAKPGAAG